MSSSSLLFTSVKCTIIALVVPLWIVLQSFPVLADEDCQKCEILPQNDCQPNQIAPFDGGPACLCATKAYLRGCHLKPCKNAEDLEVCDSSGVSTTSGSNQEHSYKFRCTASATRQQCQVCGEEVAPDCTVSSYLNVPADGGPACSCEKRNAPKGCTLKPCKKGTRNGVCICRPGTEAKTCYNTTCPGNLDYHGADDDISTGASSVVVPLQAVVIVMVYSLFIFY